MRPDCPTALRSYERLIVCLLLGSCTIGFGRRVPDQLVGMPSVVNVADRGVMSARMLLERGDRQQAMIEVMAILERNPRHVDGHRLRQDLLRRRGRMGLLRVEAEQRLEDWQDSAEAHYLRGRIASPPRKQARHFRKALDRDPSSFWAWLGFAYSQRQLDPDYALELYEELYAASGQHPLIALAYASSLRGPRRFDAAMDVYLELATDADYSGQSALGQARTLFAQEQHASSWRMLMKALRVIPHDSGVHLLLAAHLGHGLDPGRISQVVDVIWEDPERLESMVQNGGVTILAGLFERAGQLPAALATIQADGSPLRSASLRRTWRRLLLASGDIDGFLRDLTDSTPAFLVDDERNRIRGLWIALRNITWDQARDQVDALAYETLVDALVGVGMLFEADIVASIAINRCPDEPRGVVELQADLRQVLAFEGAVRRLIYRGYSVGESPSLAQVIEEIRGLSIQVLGADVVGDPEIFQLPLVGSLVNPFAEGLGQYFADRNKHLILGQRYGGSVEGLLLTRLSVRSLERDAELPLSSPCLQVVGLNREIQVKTGVFGGDLAGIALLNHYLIDMDAVQDWADSLREQRAVMSADGQVLLGDPIPDNSDPLDSVDVTWRLASLSPVRDEALLMAVFDMVCWHERAHLVDSFYYFPPVANFLRVLRLMFAHGFNPLSIESEMEGRAEAAALAYSQHTRLVLAHIASFLEATQASPHGNGFRRLAERLNGMLGADPDLRKNAQVSHWHLVDPQKIREFAENFCREYR